VTLSGEQQQQTTRDAAAALGDVTHGHPLTAHLPSTIRQQRTSVSVGWGVTK
jgi:hypothetical protein